MLTPRLFRAAAAALRPGGHLTIVTDNAWYAELAAPRVPLLSTAPSTAEPPPSLPRGRYAELLLDALARHDAFEAVPIRRPPGARLVRTDKAGRLELLEAIPGEWCGHVASGASSYFDRLWKTGLSVHSAAHDRYVLHVRTRK